MRSVLLLVLVLFVPFGLVGCTETTQPTTGAKVPVESKSESKSDSKIALISITSDPGSDLQEVNMGLTFAGFCVDEGYDVNIFLNVKGVKLATNDFSKETKFQEHKPLKEQLIALAGRGVQIHVCPVCMKDFEISNDEIISEAFVTDKPKLFSKLGADTMVFTY